METLLACSLITLTGCGLFVVVFDVTDAPESVRGINWFGAILSIAGIVIGGCGCAWRVINP